MPSPMQSYYAARAGEYDSIYRKPERQSDLRALEQWLPGKFKGMKMLEIACGTGYWTQFIAPLAAHILAIDTSPETLRIAQERVAKDKVDFAVGDAYAPPKNSPPFEAAFAGFWLSHVPQERLREFLLGLHAVLKPGAKVVFLDNRFVQGSSTPICAPDAHANTYQDRKLHDGSQHRVLKNFPTEQALHAMVAGLGQSGRYTAWPYFWAFEYVTVPAA